MKKIGVLALILVFVMLLSANSIHAQEGLTDPQQSDLQGTQDTYNNIANQVPLTPEGQIDPSKFGIQKSAAEQRIDAINAWLENNVGWMKYIFHMKPEISWLFAINFYFILFFLVVLVLNSEGLFFFIDDEKYGKLFGLALFIIFLVVKLYYGLALIVNGWITYIFQVLIPASMLFGIIILILLVLGIILAAPYAAVILKSIAEYKDKKKLAEKLSGADTSTKVMDALIKGLGSK